MLGGVFHVADEQLAIPKLLDVNDVLYNPDRQSIMTYVTLIRTAVTNKEKERLDKMAIQEKLASTEQFHQTEIVKLQEGNRALTAKLEMAEKQRNMFENQLNDEKKAHDSTRDDMENQITGLKTKLEDLQRQVEDQEQKQDNQQLKAMMGDDLENLKQEIEKYKKENAELNEKIAQNMAAEFKAQDAKTKGGDDENSISSAEFQKKMDEMKAYYEDKVRQVEQDWEKNRQEFLGYATDLQQRLTTSNTLGRQFRSKASTLEDEKQKLQDKIRQLEVEMGDKDAQLMQANMKIEELQASMESQEAVFKIQLQELGTFIKQLKAKEQEKQQAQMNDMKMQYGMGGGGNNNGYNQGGYDNYGNNNNNNNNNKQNNNQNQYNNNNANNYGGGGGGYMDDPRHGSMSQNNNGYNQGGGGAYGQQMQQGGGQGQVQKLQQQQQQQQQQQDPGHQRQQASMDSVNVQGVDQGMKLKPFDRRYESLRTKLGRERIHITWAYQSANGKQHVIVLKHDTKTNMNKESKRIIYVDGAKKYDAKSNITNWYIQLGMGQNEDRIRISIHETDSRSFDYSLSINERPFEELYAQWQQQQQQIQGGY